MKKLIRQIIGSTKKKLTSEEAVETINEVMEMTTGEESSEEEKELIKSLVKFRDTTVKQIMTARPDIIGLGWDCDFEEVLKFVSKWQFSRIPVFKQDIDKIEGVLYIKHLFQHLSAGKDFDWQKLIQPVDFIPETKKIDELLKFLQQKHQHMAVIVDEHGVTAGLVTLEDIIEEIIGEIHDEFDEEEKHFNKIDDKTFIFEAKILLTDFCKALKIEPSIFDEVKGESESLGGLILEINSDIPKKGDRILYDHFEFVIEDADNKRILSIKVLIHEEDTVNDKHE
ncbi:MAG TPA: transporter associated domain-containing protein [Cytophagaceae bacterium]|nr:transporter associated domain-containing protein [Cytophagaceae bacterium]